MGAFSTSPLHPVQPQVPAAAGPGRNGWAVVVRAAAWFIFLGGLTGAGLGIAELRVEITVAGLILACTTGLVLLKLRADSHPPA